MAKKVIERFDLIAYLDGWEHGFDAGKNFVLKKLETKVRLKKKKK
jgi:hypothetical protein